MNIPEPSTSSGSLAVATNTVLSGPGVLTSLVVTGGSAAGTAIVYDGGASGLELCRLAGVPAGTTQIYDLSHGVCFNTSLVVVVSGTASTASVHYRRN